MFPSPSSPSPFDPVLRFLAYLGIFTIFGLGAFFGWMLHAFFIGCGREAGKALCPTHGHSISTKLWKMTFE